MLWADKKQMTSRGNHLAKAKEEEGTWFICKTASPQLGLEHKGPVGSGTEYSCRPAGS